jgi:hypothetical protein
MKIAFTGTQEGMNEFQCETLHNRLVSAMAHALAIDNTDPQNHYGVYEFHHGDCIGADAQAHEIALILGYSIAIHPPLNPSKRAWCDSYIRICEPKEYLVRNREMVDECDFLFVAPKSNKEELRSGTWSTYRYADKKDMRTSILWREAIKR